MFGSTDAERDLHTGILATTAIDEVAVGFVEEYGSMFQDSSLQDRYGIFERFRGPEFLFLPQMTVFS